MDGILHPFEGMSDPTHLINVVSVEVIHFVSRFEKIAPGLSATLPQPFRNLR